LYVLEASCYLDGFPEDARVVYVPDSKQLVVEKDLPVRRCCAGCRFVQVRQRTRRNQYRPAPAASRKRLYLSVIAQLTLRTLHELFEADPYGPRGHDRFQRVPRRNRPGAGHCRPSLGVLPYQGDRMATALPGLEHACPLDHFAAEKMSGLGEIVEYSLDVVGQGLTERSAQVSACPCRFRSPPTVTLLVMALQPITRPSAFLGRSRCARVNQTLALEQARMCAVF
jgi:hypothetical protein